MAEFCTFCANNYGQEIDIPIAATFEKLQPGEVENVLCEGCELVAIEKDQDGQMQLHFKDGKGRVETQAPASD